MLGHFIQTQRLQLLKAKNHLESDTRACDDNNFLPDTSVLYFSNP